MKRNFLKRLPTEQLAKRHQMNADASALAKRDRDDNQSRNWFAGTGIQPASNHRRVMGRIGDALLVLVVCLLWLGIGALAGVQV